MASPAFHYSSLVGGFFCKLYQFNFSMSQPKFLKYNADIDFKDSAIKRETLQIIIGIDLVASLGRPDANTKN